MRNAFLLRSLKSIPVIAAICLAGFPVAARELDQLADLRVTLTSAASSATNGNPVTFYVTARNNGPTPIYAEDDCTIEFSPAAGQYGDDGSGGGDPTDAVVSGPGTIDKSGWTIAWHPGAIAPGHSVTMTVTIPLYIRNRDGLNTARVSNSYYSNSNDCDPDQSNNTPEMTLSYIPATDLSLRIDPQGFTTWDLAAGPYEVIICASNAGPSVAENSVVTNVLPSDCTYEVTWPAADHYTLENNILTWSIGDLSAGNYYLWPGYEVYLYVKITPTNGGEKTIASQVRYPYDQNAANNSAGNDMMITAAPSGGGVTTSVLLMGWDEFPTVERYGTIHYVLRVKNNMESNAVAGVVVTNLLDPRCLFDSATTPQGSVTQVNQTVVFDIGTLGAGADFNLNLFVIPLESGLMTNDARIHMNATGNEYGDSPVIEETTVNDGPYVLTVSPMQSVTPTLGYRLFEAVVQTNGQTVANVPLSAAVTRGPHKGAATNVFTLSTGPDAPAKAVLVLQDVLGYPGRDHIAVTGQVGKIPFGLNLQADWQLMGPFTYLCTNLGNILNDTSSVFEIVVPDQFAIAHIKVGLHFAHTRPSDLEFRLYSPDDEGASSIESYLIEQLGAFAYDNIEVGRSGALCILDETAATSISNAVSPFSGSYRSQFMELTNFYGAPSKGTWRLVIEDLNAAEFEYGGLLGFTLYLEPADGDLDNDDMNDQWELDNDLDPNDPNDGGDDDDSDGLLNRLEFRTHNLPQVRANRFGFHWPVVNDDQLILRWASATSQVYTVHWSTNLMEGFNVLESGILADPPENEYPVTNKALFNAFFKVDQEY